VSLGELLAVVRGDSPGASWGVWATTFERVESELHWGTVGWADTTFYRDVQDVSRPSRRPAEARAVVELKHGLAMLDWERVASAADVLVSRVCGGPVVDAAATLLDAAVVAYLRVGRPTAARNAFNLLAPLAGRDPDHLRSRLLATLILEGEAADAP
jgi:hypothetical protein